MHISVAFTQLTCKRYGGDHIDYAFQMIKDPMGNYVITGRTYSFLIDTNEFWGDLYTIKLDANHNLMWTSVFQTPFEDEGNAIDVTSDGGYMITGSSYSFSTGYDVSLVKLDGNGNLIWSKMLATPVNEKAQAICRTSDNGYLLAGYTDSVFSGIVQSFIPMLIKVDTAGNIVWSKKFGINGSVYAGSCYRVMEASDGSILVTGDIIHLMQGPEDSDHFIARFSADGNLLWLKWMGANCNGCQEMGGTLMELDSANFVSIGSNSSLGGLYMVFFDINGNILSERLLPTGYFAYTNISALRTADNGMIVTAPTASNMLVIKLDSTYATEWSSVYGNGGGNMPCTILNNGPDYTLAGHTGTSGPYREDYIIVNISNDGSSCCKTMDVTMNSNTVDLIDSSGGFAIDFYLTGTNAGSATTGGVQRPVCPGASGFAGENTDALIVYPNPSNGVVYIGGVSPEEIRLITIADMAGKPVIRSKQTMIDLTSLSNGVYSITIEYRNESHKQLLIYQRE